MKFSKILKFWCEILIKTGRGPNSFVLKKKRKEKISSVFWPLLEKLRDDTILFYGNRKVSPKAICGQKKKKFYVVKFFRNGLWNFKSGPNSFAWQYAVWNLLDVMWDFFKRNPVTLRGHASTLSFFNFAEF